MKTILVMNGMQRVLASLAAADAVRRAAEAAKPMDPPEPEPPAPGPPALTRQQRRALERAAHKAARRGKP